MVRRRLNHSTASLVAMACPAIMPLAEGEKCQGSEDSIPGRRATQGRKVRESRMPPTSRGACHAEQSQSPEEDKAKACPREGGEWPPHMGEDLSCKTKPIHCPGLVMWAWRHWEKRLAASPQAGRLCETKPIPTRRLCRATWGKQRRSPYCSKQSQCLGRLSCETKLISGPVVVQNKANSCGGS